MYWEYQYFCISIYQIIISSLRIMASRKRNKKEEIYRRKKRKFCNDGVYLPLIIFQTITRILDGYIWYQSHPFINFPYFRYPRIFILPFFLFFSIRSYHNCCCDIYRLDVYLDEKLRWWWWAGAGARTTMEIKSKSGKRVTFVKF